MASCFLRDPRKVAPLGGQEHVAGEQDALLDEDRNANNSEESLVFME